MASLKEYKCPNCGGAIHFDATKQTLVCPWCQSEIEVAGLEVFNQELAEEVIQEWQQDSQVYAEEINDFSVYSCRSCGGEIIQKDIDITSRCPFCGNEVIHTGKVSGDLRPDLIIPFQTTREQAIAEYLRHTKKKYVPRAFLDKDHIEEIRGIYVPFWLFDAETEAKYHFRGTRSRSYREGEYRVVATDHYLLVREGELSFQHVPADASSQLDDARMESIEPFDYRQAVPFHSGYLAGFLANRYDVEANEVENRAMERIRSSVREVFAETCDGYLLEGEADSSLRKLSGSKSYALLPVWLLVTKYQDNLYTFAMNGQTGKFVGDIPVDKKAMLWGAGLRFLLFFAFFVVFYWYRMYH